MNVKKKIILALLFSPCYCFHLCGENVKLLSPPKRQQKTFLKNSKDPTCGKSPRPYYITLKHIEGNGVGYNQGYTTLEGFFRTPNPDAWIPFLDVRYHFFNNGKPAANAGLGLRYLTRSRIWGMNAYYDYRKTNHQQYNQISAGLESLGKYWDFRINGYLPVGKKTSEWFNSRFDEFKNHYLYVKTKYEFAMKGANAEVGMRINRYKHVPLYFALGPYYLEGQGKAAWGGEARGSAQLFGSFRLEGSTSYDNVFKWIGQGQAALVIPFGGKKQIRPKKETSCENQVYLAKRAAQHVDRHEIIPVGKKYKHSVAIDPLTGKPYIFWFVNNTSHSNGTIESPFPTLIAAQNASSPNDVIYVFPGNGTDTGMDAGIFLQNGQQLLGAGLSYSFSTQFGPILIPAQASQSPLITNSTGSVVQAADNNYIAGCIINLGGSSIGILASDTLSGLVVDNNNLFGIAPNVLIYIIGRGPVRVTNNQCTATSGFEVMRFDISGGPMHVYVDGNSVSNGGSYGIGFNYVSGGPSSITVSNNMIQSGFEALFLGSIPGTINIEQNTFSGIGYGIGFTLSSSLNANYTVSNNNIYNFSADAIYISGGGAETSINISSNQINQVGFAVSGGEFTGSCFSFNQNQVSNYSNGVRLGFDNPSCFIDIESNTFFSSTGFAVDVDSSTAGATNCVRLLNNISPASNGYRFTASGGAVIDLEPTSSNIGTVTTSGTTPVTPGTCTCSY
jgi:hypothetical protein